MRRARPGAGWLLPLALAAGGCQHSMPTTIPFEDDAWLREERALGAGTVAPGHVVARQTGVRLVVDGASRTGAAIRTRALHDAGEFRASMRCDAPRGAVCAFFLYEPDAGDRADEIDIEILGGTREVWLTTWVGGVRTNHVALELPFDPAAGFHEYAIRRAAERVEFLVDGARLHAFDDGVPARAMALYANAWWPTWLEPNAARGAVDIERIDVLAPRPPST